MIGPYFTGDVPSQSALVELHRGPDDADLSIFDNAEVTLYDETSTAGALLSARILVEEDAVLVEWPEVSVFTGPGIYTLSITLTSVLGYREQAEDVHFIVQPAQRDGWHTLASARREWQTGAPSDDVQLWTILDAARTQCVEYAPALAEGAQPPRSWRTAQLMQARAILNAAKNDPSFDPNGDFVITSRPNPLDKFVRNILRPTKVVGFIG